MNTGDIIPKKIIILQCIGAGLIIFAHVFFLTEIAFFIWSIGLFLVIFGYVLNAFKKKKDYNVNNNIDEDFEYIWVINYLFGGIFLIVSFFFYILGFLCIIFSGNLHCGISSIVIMIFIFPGIYYVVEGIRKHKWWKENSEWIRPPKNRQNLEVEWREQKTN